MTALIQQSLVIINRLMNQNRHNDALSLLESCMCSIREQQQQHQQHTFAEAAQEEGDSAQNNNNQNLHLIQKYHSKIVMKYATCLVRLQRYEAALYTIEASCSHLHNHNQNQQQHQNQQQSQHTEKNSNNNTNLFNSNSNFITAAVVAGVIDPNPPRFLTETGPEGLVKNSSCSDDDDDENANEDKNTTSSNDDKNNTDRGYLTKAAIEIALEASLALADWYRAKLYANALLFIDARSCTALLALGKLACQSASSPTEAAAFLVRALRADPFCSSAFEMIVDNWLLPTVELEQIVLSLDFNNISNTSSSCSIAGEVQRNMYLARIPDAAVQLTSTDGVPLWLRNYHEAIVLLEANDLDGAIRCSSNALNGTALKQYLACLHLSVLTRTHETATLFRFAHLLSESFPSSAVSFYAAGCYYFSIGSFERAGRLFSRATDLDPLFAESWIAYGHCYARLEEGEQALAAYRRAQNLFPGLHQCDLFLGIQYARQHSAQLALACLENAQRGSRVTTTAMTTTDSSTALVPQQENNENSDVAAAAASMNASSIPPPRLSSTSSYDALLLNETAVLYFRSKQYAAALRFLMRARDALPNKERPADHEVCIIFNLASAFRKVNYLDLACSTYLEFIRHRPQAAVGHCAYGLTLHLQGELDEAISSYRTSLALRRDAFCRDLLERALEERHGSGYFMPTMTSNDDDGAENNDDANNDDDDGSNKKNKNGNNSSTSGIDAWLGKKSSNQQSYYNPLGGGGMNDANEEQHHHYDHHGYDASQQTTTMFAAQQQQQQNHLSVQRGFQYHPSPLPTAASHHTNQHLQNQLDSLRNPQATMTATTTGTGTGTASSSVGGVDQHSGSTGRVHHHQHAQNNNNTNSNSNSNGLNFVFDASLVPPPLVGGGHTGVVAAGEQQPQQQQQHFSVASSVATAGGRGSHHSASPRPTISRALTFQ